MDRKKGDWNDFCVFYSIIHLFINSENIYLACVMRLALCLVLKYKNKAWFLPLVMHMEETEFCTSQSWSFLNERRKGEDERKNLKDAKYHHKDMQTQTTMRHHLTSSRMVIIKLVENNKCW